MKVQRYCSALRTAQAQLIRVVPPGYPVPCYEGLEMSRRCVFKSEHAASGTVPENQACMRTKRILTNIV